MDMFRARNNSPEVIGIASLDVEKPFSAQDIALRALLPAGAGPLRHWRGLFFCIQTQDIAGKPAMTQTVLVTGANGYIAQHIILQLLAAGYRVRGSLRDPDTSGPLRTALAAQLPVTPTEDALSFIGLNLRADDGWDAAMQGVDAVMHTASPVPLVQPDDPQDVIRPAVDGAMRAVRVGDNQNAQSGPARSSPVRDCKRVWKQAFEVALTGVVTEALFWLRASKMRNPEVF